MYLDPIHTIYRRITLLLLIMLYPFVTWSQTPHFFIKKYSFPEGLSDQYVLSIFQDSRDFLWISTYNGLNRFDGKNFISYGFQQGLFISQVGFAFEDDQHRFWVAAAGNIFRFLNNRFISYPFSDSVSSTVFINSITQTKDGQLFLHTKKGSYLFASDHWEKKDMFSGSGGMPCRQMAEASDCYYYNLGDVILRQSKKGGPLLKVWEYPQHGLVYFNSIACIHDSLYVSTRDGLYKFAGVEKKELLFPGKMPAGDWITFLVDSRERCWVFRLGQRHIYVSAPGNTRQFVDSIPVSASLVSCFYEDKEHNIWVASDEGLLKIQPRQDLHFSNSENPLIGNIRGILETGENDLYIFSRENGPLKFTGKDFIQTNFQLLNPGAVRGTDFPDSWFIDEKKRLWIATRERQLFRTENGKLINCSHLLPDIRDLFWIEQNPLTRKIFISLDTLKTGNDSASWFFHPRNQQQLVINPRHSKAFANGKTIITCEGEGIRLIDENDNCFLINEQLGFTQSVPQPLFSPDYKDGFWMYGGNFGLRHFIWDNKGFPLNDMSISRTEGLPSDIITSVCTDKLGRLWAITTKGVVIIRFDGNNKSTQINELADLLNINIESPEKARLFRGTDENIWLTDKNDVYRLDPTTLLFDSRAPGIAFEDIQVNFRKTNWEKYTRKFDGFWHFPVNPVLKHHENNLQISFTGISLTTASDLFYSYQLEGLDTAWSKVSSDNRVTLANLRPGGYHFRVKAKTINSDWSEPVVFAFTIKPPFWNTWWFRLVMIAIAATIIISLYRNRVRKIQQQAFIKNQLNELEMTALKAQMNPHFIYNALNSIQSLVASDKKDDAIFYIGTFSRLLRQVLEQAENNVISLEKELQTLQFYFDLESLRLNMKPAYAIHMAENIHSFSEKIPPLILQPFVENALWHGLSKKEGMKKINIDVSIDAQWLTCVITDNGIGREKASDLKNNDVEQPASKAIEITRKRLVDFNGETEPSPVEIIDLYDANNDPAGTKVILHILRKH